MQWSALQQRFPEFMGRAMDFAHELGLDVGSLPMDHAGIRLAKPDDVRRIDEELRTLNKRQPLSNVMVNGRRIMIHKLLTPLEYQNWTIPCVEVPYPKVPHAFPVDGWEHVEFVLQSDATTPEQFAEYFRKIYGAVIERGSLDNPTAKEDAYPNPTVVFQKYPGLSIKFHPRSIETVVGT